MAKISIGCDHRGLDCKKQVIELVKKMGYEPVDFGTNSPESCDYTDYIFPAAEMLAKGECEKSIGLCYTGIGSSMGARAAAAAASRWPAPSDRAAPAQ